MRYSRNAYPDDSLVQLVRRLAGAKQIPDNLLESIQTEQDAVLIIKQHSSIAPSHKGIPRLELLNGQEIPVNVQLINYRKKRWPDKVAEAFVQRRSQPSTTPDRASE